MRLHVLYFHTLRDLTGRAEEMLDLADGARVADLVEAIVARHPRVASVRPSLLVAQDLEYVGAAEALRDGAEIALMPPVSGG